MERRSSITITVSNPKTDEEVISQSDVRELKTAPEAESDAVTVRQPPPLQSVRVARAHKLEANALQDPDLDEPTPSLKKTLLGASVPPMLRTQVVHPPRNLHPATPPPDWEPHLSSDEVAILQDQVAHLSEDRSKAGKKLLAVAAAALVLVGGVGYVFGIRNQPSEQPATDTTRLSALEAELKSKSDQLASTTAERDQLRSTSSASVARADADAAATISAQKASPAKSTTRLELAQATAESLATAKHSAPKVISNGLVSKASTRVNQPTASTSQTAQFDATAAASEAPDSAEASAPGADANEPTAVETNADASLPGPATNTAPSKTSADSPALEPGPTPETSPAEPGPAAIESEPEQP